MLHADDRGGPKSVLLLEPREPGWDPSRGSRALDLAAALRPCGVLPIVAALTPALGGVWTDIVDDIEVVRLGYPNPPVPRAFDPFDPDPGPENLFIRHWERIVFARSVAVVLTWTSRVAGPLRRGITGQDVSWWGLAESGSDWPADSWEQPRSAHRPLIRLTRLIVLEGAGPPPAFVGLFPAAPLVETVARESLARFIAQRLETIS